MYQIKMKTRFLKTEITSRDTRIIGHFIMFLKLKRNTKNNT